MINKYQEGGQLTDTQQQGLQYLAQMYAQQTGKDPQQDLQGFMQFIQQLAQQAGVQDMRQLLDMVYQQATQQAQSARRGAKLNYLKKLTNRCPEGTELMYFKAGGQVCSKCVAKIKKEACGNKVRKGQTGMRPFQGASKGTNSSQSRKKLNKELERVAGLSIPKPDPRVKGVFNDLEKNRELYERVNNPGGNKKVKKGQFGILFPEAYRRIPKVRSFVDNTVKGVSTLFNWPEGSNWIVDSETDNGDGSTTFTFIDEMTGKPYPKGPVTIWNKATVPINRGRNWVNEKIRKSAPKYNKNGGSLNRIPFNRKGLTMAYDPPVDSGPSDSGLEGAYLNSPEDFAQIPFSFPLEAPERPLTEKEKRHYESLMRSVIGLRTNLIARNQNLINYPGNIGPGNIEKSPKFNEPIMVNLRKYIK